MQQEKGFTIIEMIIVLFIISVAIVGIFSAFSIIVILNNESFDRLQASYLSQEGVEIVRNIRDTNWITNGASEDPNAWLAGLADNTTDCSSGCQADYTAAPAQGNDLVPWLGQNSPYLNIDQNGFYSYSATNSQPTKFKRKITIVGLDDHTLKVTSETFWDEKPNIINPAGATNSVKVEEILFNWY